MNTKLVTSNPVATCILDENGQMQQMFFELDEEFIESLKSKQDTRIITDSKRIEQFLSDLDIPCSIDLKHQTLRDWRLHKFSKVMSELGLISNQEDYRKKLRKFVMDETASKLKTYAEKKDELIAQVVHSIDDLQKAINLSANRLTELYSLHFPEMVDEINNVTTLARIISTTPQRGDITRDNLQDVEIPSAKIDRLLTHKDNSLGGDLDAVDLIPMQEYAGSLIDAHHRKLALERWIDTQMERTAPNLTAVAGANVGARLIAAFGSLRELAMSHSAKVQVIGAESALYSALRGRGTPPKHGIIFQIPEIGNAPYWLRGKLARKFAAKIVIAARLDEFDGDLLGPKYREEIRAYEQEMRATHPEPPQEEK